VTAARTVLEVCPNEEMAMPSGALDLHLSDLAGKPVPNVSVEFLRFAGEPGTGGETMHVTLASPDPDLRVERITCRGGIGTMYRVFAEAEHYRQYGFFQLIREDVVNTASDQVEFWVKPGDVQDIKAPSFDSLSASARNILNDADMMTQRDEDGDLLKLKGEALYRQLGPLRKASFLNLIAKAADETTAGGCVSQIGGVLVCRQDRFFARVKAGFPEVLRQSPLFKSAKDALHKPLPGFEMIGDSFKSRDAHANLQVTFMRDKVSATLAADIDIDESSGIEHGFEVIRNATFKSRTNPYLIHEFLLSADPIDKSLDPGYTFRF
jgi:hypothetical protein